MLSALTDRLRRTDELLRGRVSRNANDEERARSTVADRAADQIAEFGGSWKFIGATSIMIILWIALNSYILITGFDPVPYQLLGLVLAVIAGVQAPIIMMSQNRQGEKDRLRADLDYRSISRTSFPLLKSYDAWMCSKANACQSCLRNRTP